MTRRDVWAAAVLVTLAILLHAALPRYQVTVQSANVFRVDRWTGRVEASALGTLRSVPWATVFPERHTANVLDIVDTPEPAPAR